MILLKEVKEAVNKEYLARLQDILKTSGSYKSTITTIGKYTMAVLWYPTLTTGVTMWTGYKDTEGTGKGKIPPQII